MPDVGGGGCHHHPQPPQHSSLAARFGLDGVLHVPHLCLQLGHYGGMADELDSLKRDKNVLMLELVRLRQQQQVRCLCSRGMHMLQ